MFWVGYTSCEYECEYEYMVCEYEYEYTDYGYTYEEKHKYH